MPKQDALNKSNELFGGFKLRLEEMAATILTLEKQNRALADKEKKSEGALTGLKQEHTAQLAEIGKNEQQIAQLCNLVSRLEVDVAENRTALEPKSEYTTDDKSLVVSTDDIDSRMETQSNEQAAV